MVTILPAAQTEVYLGANYRLRLTSFGGGVQSGVGDPVSNGATAPIYNEFDSSNNFIRQWERAPDGTYKT